MPNQNVKMTTLPSGLTVVTDHYPIGGGLAAQLVICTGNLHDPEGKNGLAHFAEHMVVHGVPGRTSENFETRMQENALLEWNLSTGPQQTIYWATGKTDGVCDYLDAIALSLQACAYDAGAFSIEQGRIINEQNGNVSRPERQAFQKLKEAVFEGQPYEKWTGGLPDHLARITLDDIRTHHRSTHHTANMILFTSGDWDHDQACAWASDQPWIISGKPRYPSLTSSPRPRDVTVYDPSVSSESSGKMTEYKIMFSLTGCSLNEEMALRLGNSILNKALRWKLAAPKGIYGIGSGIDSLVDRSAKITELSGSNLRSEDVRETITTALKIIKAGIHAIDESTLESEKTKRLKEQDTREMFGITDVRSRITACVNGLLEWNDPKILGRKRAALTALTRDNVVEMLERVYNQTPIAYYRGHIQSDFPTGAELADIRGGSPIIDKNIDGNRPARELPDPSPI